jgi:hypothetical protein
MADKLAVMTKKLAVMASSPGDYERLGLSPTSIAPWEDGARTDNSAGTYEWWYFDAHLADGAKLVVTFMNKDIAEPQKPLSPAASAEPRSSRRTTLRKAGALSAGRMVDGQGPCRCAPPREPIHR